MRGNMAGKWLTGDSSSLRARSTLREKGLALGRDAPRLAISFAERRENAARWWRIEEFI